MTERDIVTELLMGSKNEINKFSTVISESTTPKVRDMLRKQLQDVLDSHARIMDYAIEKAYYHPFDPSRELKEDLKQAYTALDLETWKMEPDEELSGKQTDTPILRS
ncbi:spore coat protein [Dehalobacter sp. DCM]|uniref:spore coat protein n=1 Tax=Dehalobacter sp. DCM TaxID=2907827 RepID=UPI003081DDBF|nr:spore coat protein [Dehalobacter sp. DCM]